MSASSKCLPKVSAPRQTGIERPSPLPPRESITSSLPDKPLTETFAHLAPKDFFIHSSEYEEDLPLTLICKRWRHIYEPFLLPKARPWLPWMAQRAPSSAIMGESRELSQS